jgi:hypothetical protein
MGTPERLHRPDPERTGPIRHASTYLRDAPSGDAAQHPARAPDAPDAAEGAVAHGVRLGYKVIEEQILHGRLLAQRLGKATSKLGAGGSGEVNVLIDRVLHLYKDIGTLCVDTLETLARSPAIRSGLARAAQAAQPAQDGAGAESALGTGFAIEVASARRTQVTLDLRLRPGRFAPRVHALHAADPSVAPLTGVSFDMDPAHPEPMLRIEVPDNQPAATYTGVVVDSASNEPRGTLSVRLLP